MATFLEKATSVEATSPYTVAGAGQVMTADGIGGVSWEDPFTATAPAVGVVTTRDSRGVEQKFTTLSAALATITDATATNRRLVVVTGTITETATLVAKDYVDVYFAPGARLNCNASTASAKGITFTGINSARWYTDAPRTVEIRRTGASGERNYVVDILSPTSGMLEFEGLIFRSLTHTTARNYAFHNGAGGNVTMRDCVMYGAGTDRAYGTVMDGTSYLYDCDSYGGDNTIGGVGGNVPAGWVLNSTSTCKAHFYRCRGWGGNAGTGSEAYGWWVFSYAGQGAGQGFCYMEDCVGYGGIAAAYTDGINCHISATVHLKNCTGIGGNNGHGIGVYGTAINFARFVLEDCTGICRNANAASTDWHGLSVGATDRSRFVGGKYYGSPFVQNSCGLRLNQDAGVAGGTASDTALAEFYGVTFIGGGAGMEAQAETTQQTGCHGLKVVEAEVGARFIDCHFLGNDASAGIQVDATANAANLLFAGGSAYSSAPASNVAINSASAWENAKVFLMLLPGGVTNVTPTSGTAVGTNIQV